MKLNNRIILCGKHPWAGERGIYIGDKQIGTLGKVAHKIKMLSGIETFVMREEDWTREEEC